MRTISTHFRQKVAALTVALFCVFTIAAQNTPLPYFCGFEEVGDTAGWVFTKRATTRFTIGKAIHYTGSHSMYVSADSGKTASYGLMAAGYCAVAYKKFTFAAGNYDMLFDVNIVGELPTSDAMKVAIVPGSTKPGGATSGTNFPGTCTNYPFVDINGVDVWVNTGGWQQVHGVINIATAGDYYVAFYFKANGGNVANPPGACIDNIQIGEKKTSTDCAAMVTNISGSKTPAFNPVNYTLTWSGNAPAYEVMYFSSTKETDTTYVVVPATATATGGTWSKALSTFTEGNYTFRVRACCPGDTSLWVGINNQLIYDPALHCLDYLNLDAPGVTCTSGGFSNPRAKVGKVDRGFLSAQSIHTVHYVQGERDRLTGYALRTIPEGSLGSVRLNNWTEGNSTSGSIEYTYTVAPDNKVLLLRYAAVLQYASHHSASEQTRIHVEVMNQNNQLLSHCTEVDFNAKDVDEGNTRGWQTYMPSADEVDNTDCPIKWLDWQVLGINMASYVGQTVKIRITMYACSADFHFGYGYFALDCSKGEIEGMSCSDRATKFEVDEGFDYKWYKMSDPNKTTLGTEREFYPDPTDTASYYVDMMYPENNNCKFTLKAYTLPRLPKSHMTYTLEHKDCQTYVHVHNASGIFTVYNGVEEPQPQESITKSVWNFGKYGDGDVEGMDTTFIVPAKGDTFNITLRSEYNSCFDLKEFEIQVPEIKESLGVTNEYICEGKSVILNGKEYTQPGIYSDTLKSIYGCDSILTLNLQVLVTDTTYYTAGICTDDSIYEWRGHKYTESGIYYDSVPSDIGCNKEMHILDLKVLESINVELHEVPTACSDDETPIQIRYDVTDGMATAYMIKYDDEAKAAGFTDTDTIKDVSDFIPIDIPKANTIGINNPHYVAPNRYSAKITFFNADCGDKTYDVIFIVQPSKNSITQRWDDVLAVKSPEYNGGETYISYTWLLNGVELNQNPNVRMTGSYLYYMNGEKLDTGGEYQVIVKKVTPKGEVELKSCAFTPEAYTHGDGHIKVVLTTEGIEAKAPAAGRAYIYNVAGILLSTQTYDAGDNNISMPAAQGVYIVKFVNSDGSVQTERVVRKN